VKTLDIPDTLTKEDERGSKKMKNVNGWLFLLIAVIWLLPLINVSIGAAASGWIQTIALAIIGITMISNK